MQKTLMIMEVSQKQAYIFASQKLQQNALRSAQINYVTSEEFFLSAAPEIYHPENMVYAGGGHTVLQFDDSQQAQQFAARVTKTAMMRFPGIEMFVRKIPYNHAKTPRENLCELTRQLEEKKARRAGAFFHQAFGVETLDPVDFSPRQKNSVAECSVGIIMPEPPQGAEFASDFSELAQTQGDNFLAVVHVDGNAMGNRVNSIYQSAQNDWDLCCSSLRAFSESIQKDFEAAFQEMLQQVQQAFPQQKLLPVRPVILAGDDVCFVTTGSIGLEAARIFLQQLAQKVNDQDKKPYAACAGIALVHTKFPFYQAYELAEELCSNAKKFGASLDASKRICAMDWHIAFGQLKNDLAQIREDYATEDGGRLELRPVTVVIPPECAKQPQELDLRSYAFFRDLCLRVKSGAVRSKVKALRNAFKQGELESTFFLQDKQIHDFLYCGVDAEYAEPDKQQTKFEQIIRHGDTFEKSAFRSIQGERRCIFFDAIEMVDHFEKLGE
ncbi:hypothetical protein B5E65_05425 [Gemmiger sp. An120]|uniref:Cas10/Cmr2 second palm domain-containing protein n=1 Tax=Gemmiger sp. An120 TaxID=1965549 RepID=UPI000B3967B1|nr:hypothetical protein [Gemmiger sp. An120]OUQ43215.1 hypothetical protein B5E65_05425 [Gemmiger sp. An120]